MLREYNAKQIPGEPQRRWFSDGEWDVIVWQAQDDTVVGFQLCYQRGSEEHALTWQRDRGFFHQRVDTGEDITFGHKQAPILVADGEVDVGTLLHAFIERSTAMDAVLVEFIQGKLSTFRSETQS